MKRDVEALKASLVHVGYLFKPLKPATEVDAARAAEWVREQGFAPLRFSGEETFAEPSLWVEIRERRGRLPGPMVTIPLHGEDDFEVVAVLRGGPVEPHDGGPR